MNAPEHALEIVLPTLSRCCGRTEKRPASLSPAKRRAYQAYVDAFLAFPVLAAGIDVRGKRAEQLKYGLSFLH